MRKMKKINGYLIVRFNDRERRECPQLGAFGVIDAELYTGDLLIDRGVMEYEDAETMEIAVEQARGLEAETDYSEEPPTYTLVVEDSDGTTETTFVPQLLISGWAGELSRQVKNTCYKDMDAKAAMHELRGYKAALYDLKAIGKEERIVDPDHFAPGALEQPLPGDSEALMAHICDHLCKHRGQADEQERMDAICAECALGQLMDEATERERRLVRTAEERLDGFVHDIAAAKTEAEAQDLERAARAYLEALTTMKVLTPVELAACDFAITGAVAGRPKPPERETFTNAPSDIADSGRTKKVYALGQALLAKCPHNDCGVYLNIFKMAQELDRTLDTVKPNSYSGQFNDLKSDMPLVYTLREDFIRSMNSVDHNISGLDQKLDQVLRLMTSFGKEG